MPNTIAGMGQCMVSMVRKYAPNALVGLHASAWSTNMDVGLNTNKSLDVAGEAKKTAAFLAACGESSADLVIVETSDRDAGYYQSQGKSTFWDATNATLPDFHQDFAWVKALTEALGKPALYWQTPLGNANQNNTTNHWKDNRVDYFFAHPHELAAAHAIGAVFGAGQGDQTLPETDGGNLVAKMKAYVAGGGTPLSVSVLPDCAAVAGGGATACARYDGRVTSPFMQALAAGPQTFASDPRRRPARLRAAAGGRHTVEQAALAGLVADGLGWAFAGRLRGGARAARSRGHARRASSESLCATEEGGGHPRAIRTALAPARGRLRPVGPQVVGDPRRRRRRSSRGGERGRGARDAIACAWLGCPSEARGVTVQRRPPLPFVPEIAHAKATFEASRSTEHELLPGDGYDDALKPFRTIEDIHVMAAVLGWAIGVARASDWPRSWIGRGPRAHRASPCRERRAAARAGDARRRSRARSRSRGGCSERAAWSKAEEATCERAGSATPAARGRIERARRAPRGRLAQRSTGRDAAPGLTRA